MDQAAAQKLIDPASRKTIAANALVLIVPADSKLDLSRFEDLQKPEVKRLAMGEPKAVPAGEYATQTLKHLKLLDTLQPKIISGASVRQVLDYVERGEVDAGIVYATDAMQSGPKVRVIATADPSWHEPIHYPGRCRCDEARRPRQGVRRLSSRPTPLKKILQKHGFAPPPATQPTAAGH